MSKELRLPGRPKKPTPDASGLGEFAAGLGAEVLTDREVSADRDAGAPSEVVEVSDNDVLELGWEGGIVELVRVGDVESHFPQLQRSTDGRFEIPTHRSLETSTRGSLDVALEHLRQIRVGELIEGTLLNGAVELAVPKAVRKLEEIHMPAPGLYRIAEDGALEQRLERAPKQPEPILVLLHGTFSKTASSFRDLFESSDWSALYNHYPKRVFALEHHTVVASPAANALALARALPAGANVHLLSQSRGGLVSDLLCRHPWEDERTSVLFQAPRYAKVREELEALRALSDAFAVTRTMRVASPAAGTLLASDRLDTYLSVILSVIGKALGPGAPALSFVKSMALAILASRSKADVLPGLEAMMPHLDKGFVPFLNMAEEHPSELAVIAGAVQGGGVFDTVKKFFAHLYFREENDFVVDSKSMFRGVPRTTAHAFFYRDPRADHFSYFANEETRSRMVEWLVHARTERFEPIDNARPLGGLRSREGAPLRTIPDDDEIERLAERRKTLPVVFLLPGIMGTHLASQNNRQWIHVRRLLWGGLSKLGFAGRDIKPDGLVSRYYEKLYDHLFEQHHVIPFGFDWRLPIEEAAKRLAKSLAAELERTRRLGQPVRIVAHSMGGLVSRALVMNHPNLWGEMTKRGGRLLMLGTPNHGSYVPAQVFARKHSLLKHLARADLRSSLDELTDVVRGFPGLVEMLPFKGDTVDLLERKHWRDIPFAPTAASFGAAKEFRKRLEQEAIDPDHMIYVAGRADETPASMERRGKDVTFRYTGRGDGTVPWDLGLLQDVTTYYVEAGHGQIPNHEKSFDGFSELLVSGTTGKLEKTPPVTQRGEGEELFEVVEEEIDERYYPDESDLVSFILGDPSQEVSDEIPPLSLRVKNCDVREARYPVIVGHYEGDPIVSVEGVLDRAISGRMSRDLRLGRYPGKRNSARFYPADSASDRRGIQGVLVAGLGEIGELRRLSLEQTLGAALMEYVLENVPAAGQAKVTLGVSSVLVGTWSRITVEDSIAALVAAVRSTNSLLRDQNLIDRVSIQHIEVVELYRDIATGATYAARRIAKRSDSRVVAESLLQSTSTMRRSRPYSPYEDGWSKRIRIRTAKSEINYEVTTDLARSEPSERSVQWCHVNSVLEHATKRDPEAPGTLFQYLLPHELIEDTANAPSLVLDLDAKSAAIPWELLDPHRTPEGASQPPLGVRVSVLRTLSTIHRRAKPRRAVGQRALVVGEPAGVLPPLAGAAEEAREVSALLTSNGIEVAGPMVHAQADAIFRALYRHEYDIVHIAAHGEFDERDLDRAAGIPTVGSRSGIVLGNDCSLTSSEFENLRAVPSIVFLNCCHLAKTGASPDGGRTPLRYPGHVAASLSQALIEMGVGVVVAAGWAVGDHPARVFATTLYGELLAGANLMNAVGHARESTYRACGANDRTWGAYQVYGDPGYVLHWAGRRGGSRQIVESDFAAVHELVESVRDFSAKSNGASDDWLAMLAGQLEQLEAGIPAPWETNGSVWHAFGVAYYDLGQYEDSSRCLARAAELSDAPLESVEKLANVRARMAQEVFARSKTKGRALFRESVKRLEHLAEASPSSERWALVGASNKRWAKLDHVQRARYLKRARMAYQKAAKLREANLYYPLSNQLFLTLSVGETIAIEDIDAVEVSAQKCVEANEAWAQFGLADAVFLRYLSGRGPSAEDVARAYARAMKIGAGATKAQRDSIADHIETLVELASSDALKKRIEEARRVVGAIELS